MAAGQVDGTQQAGCEWAARFYPLLQEIGEKKAEVVLVGIMELRSHASGSLHLHPGASALFWPVGKLWVRA